MRCCGVVWRLGVRYSCFCGRDGLLSGLEGVASKGGDLGERGGVGDASAARPPAGGSGQEPGRLLTQRGAVCVADGLRFRSRRRG